MCDGDHVGNWFVGYVQKKKLSSLAVLVMVTNSGSSL